MQINLSFLVTCNLRGRHISHFYYTKSCCAALLHSDPLLTPITSSQIKSDLSLHPLRVYWTLQPSSRPNAYHSLIFWPKIVEITLSHLQNCHSWWMKPSSARRTSQSSQQRIGPFVLFDLSLWSSSGYEIVTPNVPSRYKPEWKSDRKGQWKMYHFPVSKHCNIF